MMRVTMQVVSTIEDGDTQETVTMRAVTEGESGSEDNTFARYAPAVRLTYTAPDLIGKFTQGQRFYLDFTPDTIIPPPPPPPPVSLPPVALPTTFPTSPPATGPGSD